MIGGQPFWRGLDVARLPDTTAVQILPARSATPRWVSPFTAIRLAGVLWNIDENALLSHRREQRLVEARALVVWTLRTIPAEPISYPKIGRALGGRDHATIINLHRMAIRLRLQDEHFARCCNALSLHFGLGTVNHCKNNGESRHAGR